MYQLRRLSIQAPVAEVVVAFLSKQRCFWGKEKYLLTAVRLLIRRLEMLGEELVVAFLLIMKSQDSRALSQPTVELVKAKPEGQERYTSLKTPLTQL